MRNIEVILEELLDTFPRDDANSLLILRSSHGNGDNFSKSAVIGDQWGLFNSLYGLINQFPETKDLFVAFGEFIKERDKLSKEDIDKLLKNIEGFND